MQYRVICLIAGERRAIHVEAAHAAAAVAAARGVASEPFELLAVLRGPRFEPDAAPAPIARPAR